MTQARTKSPEWSEWHLAPRTEDESLLGREEWTRWTGHSGDRRSGVRLGGGGGDGGGAGARDRKLDRQEAITAGTNEGDRRRADAGRMDGRGS